MTALRSEPGSGVSRICERSAVMRQRSASVYICPVSPGDLCCSLLAEIGVSICSDIMLTCILQLIGLEVSPHERGGL